MLDCHEGADTSSGPYEQDDLVFEGLYQLDETQPRSSRRRCGGGADEVKPIWNGGQRRLRGDGDTFGIRPERFYRRDEQLAEDPVTANEPRRALARSFDLSCAVDS